MTWLLKLKKMWQNSIFFKTQFMTKLMYDIAWKSLLVWTTWHLDNQKYVFRAAFCNLAMIFLVLDLIYMKEINLKKKNSS